MLNIQKNITIPASATSIGYQAFRNCTNLESVIFGNGSQLENIGGNAFYNCTKLTNITIPATVTSISSGAFDYCKSIVSIIIPAGVINMYPAFYNWTSAQIIYIAGFANQVAADAAWNTNWRNACDAIVIYQGTN